jgi:phage recombination protein Bet
VPIQKESDATKMTTTMTPQTLPEPVARRGINESQWRTMCLSLYPGARAESVLLVIDYCLARRLDPLKKPCHIVPMEVRKADTNTYEWRDVVMPGIYELRTTAQRTGEYLGHSVPDYGPTKDFKGTAAPEWCNITFYRWSRIANRPIEFPVRTFFREVVATTKDGKPNSRWARAPIQMLSKCTEAAGLREAFPDELGGEHVEEEMAGQRAVDVSDETLPTREMPSGYEDWLSDLLAACEAGDPIAVAWEKSPEACRTYLAETDAATFEAIKAKATETPAP